MARAKEEFKWFGEGFSGFPKHLPEDCVEYNLYVISPDVPLSDTLRLQPRLEEIQTAAKELQHKYLREHLWQRQGFGLDLRVEDGRSFLYGRTEFGDAVEDEWLVVFLLRELSRRFEDLWIRVVDADGEFLLVEAANVLPRWLNPEVAGHRVWINKGNLLIIPPDLKGRDTADSRKGAKKNLSHEQALHLLPTSSASFTHSTLIEEEAFYRLRDYPARISESQHHAIATIPRNLAFILRQRPDFIGSAVEAFYLRDPIAMRPLQTGSETKTKKLLFPPSDLVTVSVKFTRVMYAQLRSQEFPAPPAWSKLLQSVKDPVERKRAEIGMKVTSGFEMLLGDRQNKDSDSVKQIRRLLATFTKDSLTDEAITNGSRRDDDDTWLDINFEDFEQELSGKTNKGKKKSPAGDMPAFGDKAAQENLRKMVERFEDFLNDDTAGSEGAEVLDDMDYDDDEEDDDDNDGSEGSSQGEDKDVSFNEKEFARMMREMMGMPSEGEEPGGADSSHQRKNRIEELDSEDDSGKDNNEDEAEAIRSVMQRMEAELTESGALNLDPTPKKMAATKAAVKGPRDNERSGQAQEEDEGDGSEEEEEEDDEIDIDLNLARNLLESFKSQAGTAGPGGNLMGLLGTSIPRDEAEERRRRR